MSAKRPSSKLTAKFLAEVGSPGKVKINDFEIVANVADELPPFELDFEQFYANKLYSSRPSVLPVDAEKLLGIDENTGLKCKGCKKRGGVTYVLRQVRSADEGSTAFYTCSACLLSWS
jgi:DNA-directed RNA polymerase subunit M/transcription elongation factor TFIIS